MALTFPGLLHFLNVTINLPSFPIFVGYILMICCAGFYKNVSRPMSLRPALIVYNLLCSVLSAYTFIGFLLGMWHHLNDLFSCEASDYLRPFYFMYWVSKNLELMDTVFMVVRHRQRQISFLHVYHHSSMLLLSDYAFRLSPWPSIAFFLCLNSLVHVVLYFYYGLTAWDSSRTPGWKQRLTEMQILQFFVDFIYAFVGYYHHNFCVYSLLYGVAMTSLFSNFYYHAYLKPSSKSSSLKSKSQ